MEPIVFEVIDNRSGKVMRHVEVSVATLVIWGVFLVLTTWLLVR